MFPLINQIYNFFYTIPIYRQAKKKKYIYFESLQQIRKLFVERRLHHPAIDDLTDLIFTYGNRTRLLGYYSDNIRNQEFVSASLRILEKEISVVFTICYDVLALDSQPMRRHTI